MYELFNPKVYLWEKKDSKKICLIEREDLLDLAQLLGTEEQPYAIGKKENLPIVLNKSGYPGLTILHEVWRNEAKTLYEDICNQL